MDDFYSLSQELDGVLGLDPKVGLPTACCSKDDVI